MNSIDELALKNIRPGCYEIAQSDQGRWHIHHDRIEPCAQFVLDIIKKDYQNLTAIPPHSRVNHLTFDGVDRIQLFKDRFLSNDKLQNLNKLWDLIIVTTLMDAGAGDTWKYQDPITHKSYTRSEGLAAASFQLIYQNYLGDKEDPFQVEKVLSLSIDDFAKVFQVQTSNPLSGLEQRVKTLHDLAKIIKNHAELRSPGRLFALLKKRHSSLSASNILEGLLIEFNSMWPSHLKKGGLHLGDTWQHPFAKDKTISFHKLVQWLTYSLIHICKIHAQPILGEEELTGLPEYRNGGLFIDMEVLTPVETIDPDQILEVSDPLVIEWRAKTVYLLDQVHQCLKDKFQLNLSLAQVLEGGTWKAGRIIAREKRGGTSPLKLNLQGNIF